MRVGEIVFLLEERSAEEMLKGVLPRLIPDEPRIIVRYIVFEGKQDLEKQLARKLRGYLNRDARFIILRDQDSAKDCRALKARLHEECVRGGRPEAVVRIACKELESFYLGDLVAVEDVYRIKNLRRRQTERKFRDPDLLGSPSRELAAITRDQYQKVSGSREIGKLLDVDARRSTSFQHLVEAIRTQSNALLRGFTET